MDYGILSLLPPILAIALALFLRNAIVALFLAVVVGVFILQQFQPLATVTGVMDSVIAAFSTRYGVIILIVMAMAFGMSELIEKSGGANGFIDLVTNKTKLVKSRRASMMLTWVIGVILYMNCVMSIVLTTLTTKSLNDNFRVSRVKQGYIIRATGSPMNGLIPIGQWGGVLLGLLAAAGIEDGNAMLFSIMPLNFYCIIAVLFTLVCIWFDWDFLAMKKNEMRAKTTGAIHPEGYRETEKEEAEVVERHAGASFVLVPTVALLALTILYMLITGGGNITAGDALGGILFSTIVTCAITLGMNILSKNMSGSEAYSIFMGGMGKSMEILVILVMAVTFGSTVSQLGTGLYLANVFSGIITPAFLPALIFLIGGIVGYATGTSTGTVSTMIPIAVPWAIAFGANLPLTIAAAWGAAFFGTQTSPISDETFLTTGLVGIDMYEHNKVQMQYNFILFFITFVLYVIVGFLM